MSWTLRHLRGACDMSFCILRTKKLKGIGAVASSGRHTFREDVTPNADPARTPKNRIVGANSSASLLGALRSLLPEKRRKDAVLAIEYLITASPEFFQDEHGANATRSEFFNAGLRFLRLRHGEKNIISAALHLDEKTPHLVVYAVPLNADGKLCAKDFLGGRAKLTQLQSDFHDVVGKSFGLQRGVRGSRASHQDIKKFYSNMQDQPQLQPLSTLDKVAGIFGFKTKASKQREEQEIQMVAHAHANSRQAMLQVKAEQTWLSEKVAAERDRSDRLENRIAEEQSTAFKLAQELRSSKALADAERQQAIALYKQNQQLRTVNVQSDNSTNKELQHVDPKSKSGLAR